MRQARVQVGNNICLVYCRVKFERFLYDNVFEAGKSDRSTVDSFMKFRALKEKERKTFFTKKSQESKKDKKTVKVSLYATIGIKTISTPIS